MSFQVDKVWDLDWGGHQVKRLSTYLVNSPVISSFTLPIWSRIFFNACKGIGIAISLSNEHYMLVGGSQTRQDYPSIRPI